MEEEKCQCGCVPERSEFATLEENLLKAELVRNLAETVESLSRVASEPNNPLLKQTVNLLLEKIRKTIGGM